MVFTQNHPGNPVKGDAGISKGELQAVAKIAQALRKKALEITNPNVRRFCQDIATELSVLFHETREGSVLSQKGKEKLAVFLSFATSTAGSQLKENDREYLAGISKKLSPKEKKEAAKVYSDALETYDSAFKCKT